MVNIIIFIKKDKYTKLIIGSSIEKLMGSLQVELKGQPTIPFVPKRQQLCAAKYTDGDLWHRARIEGVKGDQVEV
jgi:hypothetical protein